MPIELGLRPIRNGDGFFITLSKSQEAKQEACRGRQGRSKKAVASFDFRLVDLQSMPCSLTKGTMNMRVRGRHLRHSHLHS